MTFTSAKDKILSNYQMTNFEFFLIEREKDCQIRQTKDDF